MTPAKPKSYFNSRTAQRELIEMARTMDMKALANESRGDSQDGQEIGHFDQGVEDDQVIANQLGTTSQSDQRPRAHRD